jgi:hypothetical protein
MEEEKGQKGAKPAAHMENTYGRVQQAPTQGRISQNFQN